NLEKFAPFAATEAILMETVKQGANRQDIHETLRDLAMKAWNDVSENKPNPMEKLLKSNEKINKFLNENQIRELLDVKTHVGTAPERAKKLIQDILQYCDKIKK